MADGKIISFRLGLTSSYQKIQCVWQPYFVNVPRKISIAQISSHGAPRNISSTPQLMKKANSANTSIARANFIARIVTVRPPRASRGIAFPTAPG